MVTSETHTNNPILATTAKGNKSCKSEKSDLKACEECRFKICRPCHFQEQCSFLEGDLHFGTES